MKCYQAKAGELAKQWYVIDATEQVVGRLAAQIAPILMGKHRPTYTPHIDTGDYVIVTNVDKVVFTGNKWQQKCYQRYSGYPGGQRDEAAWKLFQRRPERILELAIQRMMPKSKMGRHMMAKLKLYVGAEAPAPGPVPDPARSPLGPSRLRRVPSSRPRRTAEGASDRVPVEGGHVESEPPQADAAAPPTQTEPAALAAHAESSERDEPHARPTGPTKPKPRRPANRPNPDRSRTPDPKRATRPCQRPTKTSLHLGHRPAQDGRRPRPDPRRDRQVPGQRPGRRTSTSRSRSSGPTSAPR